MPDQLSEVANGVYQVRLPLPFALNSVSCYLLRDGDGWVIVDAGLDYEPGRAGWTAAFASLGIAPHAVTRIILTHAHPDHYGMAAWLAQQSGAPISLSAGERAFAERVWISGGYSSSDFVDFFRGYGLPEAEAVQVQRDMVALRAMTGVANTMQVIAAGDVIQIGPRQFAAVSTPGHSDGHLSFYCADERLMLSGDAVLSKITPNIGLWPGGNLHPLATFLRTLDELVTYDVDLALPGHGPLIRNFRERIGQLRTHHDERLGLMEQTAGTGANAYDVCVQVFPVATYSSHQMRFALAETLAHLEYLVEQERLVRDDRNGVPVYRRHQPVF